jgi:hypothetical protein
MLFVRRERITERSTMKQIKLAAVRELEANASCITDNRFAIVRCLHIDVVDYDHRSVVSVSRALDVHNASCSAAHVLDDSQFIGALLFDDEDGDINERASEEMFVTLVQKALISDAAVANYIA